MDVIELRTDLHSMIDKITDSNILNAVKTLLAGNTAIQTDWWDTISNDERAEIEQGLAEADRGEVISHVGYNVDGTPITPKILIKRIKAASERVKSGNFLTQEEVEKELENW